MLPFANGFASGLMPQPPQPKRRGLLAGLGDLLVPGEGFSDADREKLMRRGLLEAAITTLATPTGTGSALMGVSRGLLGGMQGVEQGASDLERQRYTQSIRNQQLAGQQREQRLDELRRMAYNPDGSINQQGMAQLRQFDPLAAAEFEKAVTPKDERPSFIRELDYLRQNPEYLPLAQELHGIKNPGTFNYIQGLGLAYDERRNQFVPVNGGAPGGAPAPGGAKYPDALGGYGMDGQPAPDFNALPPEARRRAAELDAQGLPWSIVNGEFREGFPDGSMPAPAPAPNPIVASSEAPLEITGDARAWWRTATPEDRQSYLDRVGGQKESADPATLRKEFDAVTKDYRIIRDSVAKVESAATSGTAAGDMSLIFAYMKMLDPASTVREGEYASAQNTTGVPGQIINLYNKAKDGQFLSQQQRADFVTEARSIAARKQREFETNYTRYAELARRQGLNPDDVVFDPFAESSGNSDIDALIQEYSQ